MYHLAKKAGKYHVSYFLFSFQDIYDLLVRDYSLCIVGYDALD